MTAQAETTHPDDLRFQFKVIEGLAESVRQQTILFGQVLTEMGDMKASIARIEARDYGTKVAELESKVNLLCADKERRDGASGVWRAIIKSPIVGWVVMLAAAVYLAITGKVEV